jgi:hypothetical protein
MVDEAWRIVLCVLFFFCDVMSLYGHAIKRPQEHSTFSLWFWHRPMTKRVFLVIIGWSTLFSADWVGKHCHQEQCRTWSNTQTDVRISWTLDGLAVWHYDNQLYVSIAINLTLAYLGAWSSLVAWALSGSLSPPRQVFVCSDLLYMIVANSLPFGVTFWARLYLATAASTASPCDQMNRFTVFEVRFF